MKFGNSLSNQIEETLPEWRDKFLSYKELKKRLKMIDREGGGGEKKVVVDSSEGGDSRPSKRSKLAADGGGGDCSTATATITSDSEVGEKEVIRMTKEEIDFTRLLDAELEKFNLFFEEKEEEYIIRLKELQDRVAKAKESNEELIKARKEIVDFHGEMVLLENYSALNYTGLVKILKKYDKITGALIRLPFIQRVLKQPFFRTDVLYKLVKECEIMLDRLFPINEASVSTETTTDEEKQVSNMTPAADKKDDLLSGSKELAEIEQMESLYMKSTVSALRVLKEIRSKSSTVSVFSLPPMQSNTSLEEIWNKSSIVEQTTK